MLYFSLYNFRYRLDLDCEGGSHSITKMTVKVKRALDRTIALAHELALAGTAAQTLQSMLVSISPNEN